jgi:hypothetical protein
VDERALVSIPTCKIKLQEVFVFAAAAGAIAIGLAGRVRIFCPTKYAAAPPTKAAAMAA